VCGGGRYDGLIGQLGGPELPGFGFGMGVERILMIQDMMGAAPAAERVVDAFLAALPDGRLEALKLLRALREAGVRADMDHAARSLKAQFKHADRLGARFALIVGGDELARGAVRLRDMARSAETEVPISDAVGLIKSQMEEEGAGV